VIARDPPFLRAEQFIGVGIAMTKQSKPLWIGLMIYAASFLLMGVGSPIRGSGGIPAWLCAVFALVDPFTSPRIPNSPIYQHGTIEYVAMELSGCVNLVVLAFVGLVLFGRSPWIANVFRIMSPLMIPFSWLIFHYENLFPREGHDLWIIGIVLLVLFGRSRSDQETQQLTATI
jgi:hypothetical protein